LQMWVLNPTRMRIIKGQNSFIDGYVYQSAQEGNITIPEKEIIHLAKLHPAARPEEIIGMNIFGVGLVSAALEYANIDREVSDYLARLFANNTVPPLIAKFPERFDQDEWQKLKSAWNEELPDYKLRALLGGGMQLELPPKGELSVSYDSVSKDVRAQISQVFGVPPGMLDGSFQNRATAEVQWAIFRQNTIDPEALYIAEEFTRHFRRWEEDVLIEAQPYEYNDPDADMRQEEFELKWGIKTINEARGVRGYDAVPEGNTPLIASGYVPLQSAVNPAPAPFMPRNVETRSLTAKRAKLPLITAEYKDYFWRQFDGITETNSERFDSVVKMIIAQVKEQVFQLADEGILSLEGVEISDKDFENYDEIIAKACDKVTQELLQELSIGESDLTGVVGQEIKKMVADSSAQIRDSIGIIKEEVEKTLVDNADKTSEELNKILTDKFDSLSTSRAKAIANTTSANVTSGMQYAVYKDQGFDMMWLTQRDGRVRPAHQSMEGQKQGEDGYFTVAGEKTTRPLGPNLSAGNSVNCRCQLFPVQA